MIFAWFLPLNENIVLRYISLYFSTKSNTFLVLKNRIKDWVLPYCSGWTAVTIHGREPTTERHGGFDLLRFRPGPVHPSLDDLVVSGSPRNTISIPNLVWTPDRHSHLQPRNSWAQTIRQTQPPSSLDYRHTPLHPARDNGSSSVDTSE